MQGAAIIRSVDGPQKELKTNVCMTPPGGGDQFCLSDTQRLRTIFSFILN